MLYVRQCLLVQTVIVFSCCASASGGAQQRACKRSALCAQHKKSTKIEWLLYCTVQDLVNHFLYVVVLLYAVGRAKGIFLCPVASQPSFRSESGDSQYSWSRHYFNRSLTKPQSIAIYANVQDLTGSPFIHALTTRKRLNTQIIWAKYEEMEVADLWEKVLWAGVCRWNIQIYGVVWRTLPHRAETYGLLR